MPASVTLHQLSYSTPDNQPLFTALDLSFANQRTGLIGRNGTGKSTLLAIIAGLIQPASGSVTLQGSTGMLEQSVQVGENQTIADQLVIVPDLARLDRLERGEGSVEDAGEADWSLPGRIETALKQVGLPAYDTDRPLATLSGGQRTRLALARLILAEPEIILLDEPTNNLDAGGRQAVVDLLHNWRGAAIVVSHDRSLLREMDAIVELTTLGARTYGGNWDHYAECKALELASAVHDLATSTRKVVEIDRKLQAVAEKKARKDGAGKRKAARGDIPKIMLGGMKENAENTSGEGARLANRLRSDAAEAASEARSKVEILTPLSVTLTPTGLPAGRTVLQADALTGGPDASAPIIRDLSLQLTGPERVAITGPNGSGKTTLLRLLTGALPASSGVARILVPYAILDQSVSLLDPALSIRDNFRALNPDADENTGRAALARFMFRADAALQLAGTLSGGEMLRAGLACTIGGNHPPHLLILDEPTNHLDIHAVEQVEAGLRGYDGALLVVSHDEDFLEAIGTSRKIALTMNGF
ncbi:ATPase components of ABC transporters with duplicated ATPase domains [Devosia sp. YR412]|uniref:ABC-F family ATP-binding cassette domain-containing protein n=1 Tax=Devosia sp. YR412 TaxID=1881030 RepID=UPI0008C15D3D|nr:ABC-F family ATP-binding cassette domain-containing protein [Devosia sp. YR412]SEP98724.1 ATPase components of ABC transporters with duplicated ATPase domains [Devosia sp. YR412]